MSLKSDLLKKGAGKFTKIVTDIWRGSGKPVAQSASKEIVPYVPPKASWWSQRPTWQKVAIGAAAPVVAPMIPPLAINVVKGYGDILKNAWGVGDNQPADTTFDVSQIKSPADTYLEQQKPIYDLLESYGTQPQELRDLASQLTPKGTGGGAVGGNAQSGYTAAQKRAMLDAASTGGTSTGSLTPVAGQTALSVDAFTPAGNMAQAQLNQIQAAANAAGVKLTNDMKLKYMNALYADAIKRQSAAQQAIMNQKLQDITTANQLRMAPVRVPDMKAIQAKASEYNNLDANTKKYLAARGIRNQADYVNNYVNSIQG